MADFEKLKNAIGELDEDTVNEIIAEVMSDGGKEVSKALAALQDGLAIVGDLFEKKEYFVGDLIYAGQLMTDSVNAMKSALVADASGKSSTKLILCTVHGDLHDIGKNIVKAFLEASGFEVLDLGIDTEPEKIVSTAKSEGISIIALSGVLTIAIKSMKATVEAFESAGMRGEVKIIVGGNCINENICKEIGADAWAYSPQDTSRICRQWAGL